MTDKEARRAFTPVEERAVHLAVFSAIDRALSGRLADAIRDLASNPLARVHPAGMTNLGSLYLQSGDAARALAAFDAAVALAPDDDGAICNRGVALQRLGRHQEALAAYDAAIGCAASNVMAHFNRGNILTLAGRLDEAAAAFDRAVALDPALFDAHLNRGVVAIRQQDFPRALAAFAAALAVRPHATEAFDAYVAVLHQLGRRQEAARLRRPAAARLPAPGVEGALGRARALIETERFGEALSLAAHVPAEGPAGARGLSLQSAALWKLGRFDEALAAGREAVRLDPANTDIREMFAYQCLKAGDFERGWAEYEFRLEKPPPRMRRADLAVPLWSGEALAGKRIVVVREQGHGDTLQFVRYLALLHGRGAEVTAIVQKPLLGILRSLRAPITWTEEWRPAGPFDYQVPLLSLPHRFETRLDTIPRAVPYLFADPDRVAAWRVRIGEGGYRIGIAWQGNPAYASDHARSIPLARFAPLAAVAGVRLISLQAVHGLAQLAKLPAGMAVERLGPQVEDNPDGMAEIAAAMAGLDLVVTSDTAMAHLAGALGVSTFVALPHDADWRWLRERTDSPWYPTLRLFRQARPGDWEGVFRAIAGAVGAPQPVIPAKETE